MKKQQRTTVKQRGTSGRAGPRLSGVRQIRGSTDAAGLSVGVVVSRFNPILTGNLLKAFSACLKELGGGKASVTAYHVPGAYEIPFVVEKLAGQGGFDVLVGLGCVIQGETPHAGLINHTVAVALNEIGRLYGVPVIDGVVTAHTEAQAVARCTAGRESRGWYAGEAAVEMARLNRRLGGGGT